MTHKELIEGCARGRKAAQDRLYNEYAGRLFAVCLRYTRNRMEAEDLLQECFVKVFRNIHTVKNESENALYFWMRRILINLTLNYLRDQKKYRLTEDVSNYEDLLTNEAEEEEGALLSASLHPEEVIQLIGELPDGYRTVFNLYVFEEYSHQQIAELLGVSVNTSKTQLLKARRAIVAGLQKRNNVETIYKLVI